MVRLPPTRSNCWSCSNRRTLACAGKGLSPISSSSRVPHRRPRLRGASGRSKLRPRGGQRAAVILGDPGGYTYKPKPVPVGFVVANGSKSSPANSAVGRAGRVDPHAASGRRDFDRVDRQIRHQRQELVAVEGGDERFVRAAPTRCRSASGRTEATACRMRTRTSHGRRRAGEVEPAAHCAFVPDDLGQHHARFVRRDAVGCRGAEGGFDRHVEAGERGADFVGDAGREPADGGQLLAAQQLRPLLSLNLLSSPSSLHAPTEPGAPAAVFRSQRAVAIWISFISHTPPESEIQ